MVIIIVIIIIIITITIIIIIMIIIALITPLRLGSDAALGRFAGVNQRLKFNDLNRLN